MELDRDTKKSGSVTIIDIIIIIIIIIILYYISDLSFPPSRMPASIELSINLVVCLSDLCPFTNNYFLLLMLADKNFCVCRNAETATVVSNMNSGSTLITAARKGRRQYRRCHGGTVKPSGAGGALRELQKAAKAMAVLGRNCSQADSSAHHGICVTT